MVLFKEFVWRSQDRIVCLCRCVWDREIKIPTRVTPERTSSREIRLCPSLRSSYRSVMCFLTWERKGRRGNEGTVKRWRRGGGWGAEKGERGRKVNSTLQSSLCWLNTVDICQADCPAARPEGWWQRLPRRQRRSTSCDPLVSVGMTSPPQWVQWGGGSSPVATPADTVTQQPDRHQCLFLLESGTLSETDGRRLFEAEQRRNNGSAKLWWIKQYIYCVLLRNAVVYFGTIVSVLHLLYKIDDLSFKLHLQYHFVYETTTELIMECQHRPSELELQCKHVKWADKVMWLWSGRINQRKTICGGKKVEILGK